VPVREEDAPAAVCVGFTAFIASCDFALGFCAPSQDMMTLSSGVSVACVFHKVCASGKTSALPPAPPAADRATPLP
jgi:hypothetical protein